MPSFNDIKTIYNPSRQGTTFPWDYMEEWIASAEELGLQLEPDFQRAHVWNEAQQIAYVEHVLRDGYAGRTIYFNRGKWVWREKATGKLYFGGLSKEREAEASWQGYYMYYLVDGLQRLTAARRFMRGQIPAFGHYREAWTGHLPMHVSFSAVFGELNNRADILSWYLDINSGGVLHTTDEIERVRALLSAEQAKG